MSKHIVAPKHRLERGQTYLEQAAASMNAAMAEVRSLVPDSEATSAILVALLKVEHIATPDGMRCPWCDGSKKYTKGGHRDGCARQAAVALLAEGSVRP